jgi:hypothetical protein
MRGSPHDVVKSPMADRQLALMREAAARALPAEHAFRKALEEAAESHTAGSMVAIAVVAKRTPLGDLLKVSAAMRALTMAPGRA